MAGKDELVDRLKTDWTETEKVILRRRSVRIYQKEQVPEFMVKRILEAGRFAPTAANNQAYKFVVIRDPKIIDELTDATVSVARLLLISLDYTRPWFGWLRPMANLMARLLPGDMHPIPFAILPLVAKRKLPLYYNAPTVILFFKDVRAVGDPALNVGIAGQNMCLAAHSMGLGTCWVSFAKIAFQYMPKLYKKLDIGYPYKFCSSMAIGWPVGEPDGMVTRQTNAVDWYENGTKRVVS